MKTVKEVSNITNISIRTLRYYDEIGLLKPSMFSEAGYRLYDNKALERLQQIMFFRELEIPLSDIKEIIDNPDLDKKQILSTQKELLLKKRNRLNGILELIDDVMEGVNTMSFEAFSEEDITKILDHTLECMSKEALDSQVEKYGSVEKYREYLATGFSNEQAMKDLISWYGSKEKALDAVMSSTGDENQFSDNRDDVKSVYIELIEADKQKDLELESKAVAKLADIYKKMFKLDNARAILIDLAKEYLRKEKLAEITDKEYGDGCSMCVARSIMRYYGCEE